MPSSLGALIGPLFDSQTPPAQDKKRAAKPKAKKSKRGTPEAKTSAGEGAVTSPNQQHGELASSAEPKMPTEKEMTHDHARHAKMRATQDWVDGRITDKQHKNVHDRANHVLMGRKPKEFKGTTGEKAPKKGVMGW